MHYFVLQQRERIYRKTIHFVKCFAKVFFIFFIFSKALFGKQQYAFFIYRHTTDKLHGLYAASVIFYNCNLL